MSEYRRTRSIEIGGRKYRVVTTATEEELNRLVARVGSKLKEVCGNRTPTPDGMLLTAIAFAHEAESERARAERIVEKATVGARDLLERVESVLEDSAELADE